MKALGKEQGMCKKNLKSIDSMRQKVVSKNKNYSFLRIDKLGLSKFLITEDGISIILKNPENLTKL